MRPRITQVLALVAVVAVAAIGVGCGSDQAASGPTSEPERQQSLAERMAGAVAGKLPYGGTLPPTIPASQIAAMSDGRVDWDEFRQSAVDAVACMREGGLTVTDPVTSRGGRFIDYSWSIATPPGQDHKAASARAQAVYADCYATHEALIREAWLRQTTLSEEERRKVANEVARCLRDHGINVGDDLPIEEVVAKIPPQTATEEQLACYQVHQESLVVPDDGGR